jgi:hypothetical protein
MNPSTQRRALALGMLLSAVLSAASADLTPSQAWTEEYPELTVQIARLATAKPEWRSRLKAEALDAQALILPTDKEPLTVVFRRMDALRELSEKRGWLPAAELSEVKAQLASWPPIDVDPSDPTGVEQDHPAPVHP